MILAAFDIIIAICKKAGYTDEDCQVIAGIAEDTSFPLVDFNGDLIEFYGSNPSGHPLTVIINGLVNSLYMRYCYAVLSPEKNARQFQKHIKLMTYGDDNVMGVSKDIDFFNHTAIQQVLANVDVTYTMAEKEAASVPFIHINDVSFLKRYWKYDDDIGAYVCPLEHESIEKMLMVMVKSKSVPIEQQVVDVVGTALREYFWYGKQTFENKRTLLLGLLDEDCYRPYIHGGNTPTWDELYDAFWSYSA